MTTTEDGKSGGVQPGATSATGTQARELSPAAQRALAEAAERRAKHEAAAKAAEQAANQTAELGGRAGPDPVRYGDWENGGIASDF